MSPSSAAALGPRDASLRPVAGGSRWVSAGAYLAVLAVALLATAVDPLYGVAVALAAVGAAVFAGRPALSAYTMVALVPLTSGLGRGVPIPGFRLSELVTVGLGLLVIVTADYRNQRSFTAIDAALALYALTTLGLGIAARVRTGDPVSGGDLNVLIGPVQFLIFYRALVLALVTQAQRLRALVIVVVSSIVMSLLAILQTLSPAVDTQLRSLTDYNVTDYSGSGIIRASALFPHFQVLSIYLALTILLGVALLVFAGLVGWTRVAVAVAVGLAAVALVETVTLTTIAGTTLGVAALLAMSDRRARYLTVLGIVAVIIGAAFAPTLSKRAHEQTSVVAGTAASDRNPLIPQTVAYRYDVWTKQSIPAMSGHLLVGVGPTLPTGQVWKSTESMYFTLLFRGGFVLLAVWLALMLAVARAGLQARRSLEPGRAAAGRAAVVAVAVLLPMCIVQPYLTYGGGSHVFWLIAAVAVGGVGGLAQQAPTAVAEA